MGDPFTPLVAGAKAAGPLLSLIGDRLKRTDSELIHDSFVRAIAEIRREDHHVDAGQVPTKPPGKLSRYTKKIFRSPERFPAGGRNSPDVGRIKKVKERREHKASGQRVAAQLTHALTTASSGAVDQARSRQIIWTEALRQFLKKAAAEGIQSSRQIEQRAWWYVVAGDPNDIPSENAVGDWATRMSAKVTSAWRNDLAGLVIQLHHKDDYELRLALVTSSRDIAKNLWRLVTVGVPLALLGGGAITLLVLCIDKG